MLRLHGLNTYNSELHIQKLLLTTGVNFSNGTIWWSSGSDILCLILKFALSKFDPYWTVYCCKHELNNSWWSCLRPLLLLFEDPSMTSFFSVIVSLLEFKKHYLNPFASSTFFFPPTRGQMRPPTQLSHQLRGREMSEFLKIQICTVSCPSWKENSVFIKTVFSCDLVSQC